MTLLSVKASISFKQMQGMKCLPVLLKKKISSDPHLKVVNSFRAFTIIPSIHRNGYPEQCHRKSYDLIQQGGLAISAHERGGCYCDCHQ